MSPPPPPPPLMSCPLFFFIAHGHDFLYLSLILPPPALGSCILQGVYGVEEGHNVHQRAKTCSNVVFCVLQQKFIHNLHPPLSSSGSANLMLDKKNHEQEVTKRPLNIPIYTNSMPVHSPTQLIGNYCRASTAQVTMVLGC